MRILVAGAVLLAALAGCGTAPDPTPPGADAASPGLDPGGAASSGPGSAAPPSGSDPSLVAGFNGTDRGWIELMIALDEKALPLLQTASTRAVDPSLRRLAGDIGTTHRAELVHLRQWHNEAGLPKENPHEGHDMPGLVTPADLSAISGARGTALDSLVRPLLVEHLDQRAQLASSEQKAGAKPETVALAAEVERTSRAHRARLP